MSEKYQIGDPAHLKVPVRGYRYVEIVDTDGDQLVVRTINGWEFPVQEDELEECC